MDNKTILERINNKFKEQVGFDILNHLIVLGRIGSHSHGTYIPPDNPESIDDIDFMGIFIPPVSNMLGLNTIEHWTCQFEELDVVLYSLDKAIRMLMKNNPNIIGLLWLRPEDYFVTTPTFEMLQQARNEFVTQQIATSFIGYAHGQLNKLENGAFKGYMGDKRKQLVMERGYDTKNASHLIRILRMGIEYFMTGTLSVYRPDAEELIAIKKGAWSLEQVKNEANALFEQFRAAETNIKLPTSVNHDVINSMLINMKIEKILKYRV